MNQILVPEKCYKCKTHLGCVEYRKTIEIGLNHYCDSKVIVSDIKLINS